MLAVLGSAALILAVLGSTVLILWLFYSSGGANANLTDAEFLAALTLPGAIGFAVGTTWAVRPAIPVAAVALVAAIGAAFVLVAAVWMAQGRDCNQYVQEWECYEIFEAAWRSSASIGGGWIAAIGTGALVTSVLKHLVRRPPATKGQA